LEEYVEELLMEFDKIEFEFYAENKKEEIKSEVHLQE
jgi:hypothetical protein